MNSKLNKVMRIVHTVKYLKPSQIYFQLVNRVRKRTSIDEINESPFFIKEFSCYIPELDADEKYAERFAINKLLEDTVTILNSESLFPYEKWHNDEKSHLWNFNLHYLEYCIPLAAKYAQTRDAKYLNKCEDILKSWLEFGVRDKDAANAYTISLRTINILIIISCIGNDMDSKIKMQLLDSVYAQYKWLQKNTERHLLGNHYFENLKAIVIGSVFFDDKETYEKYVQLLLKEMNEQILQNGLHFELSLMYHKIILEDLIRVGYVLQQAEKKEVDAIVSAIEKMSQALLYLESDMGKTPFFNDAADGVSKTISQLLDAASSLFHINVAGQNKSEPTKVDGYFKYYSHENRCATLIDCGEIGPSYMPGHGHCDCLSFEVSVDNCPLFVNSGTYLYQGKERSWFRATNAHNTVVINGREQSECWGEHRVARRIHNVNFSVKQNEFIGEYKNYCGEKHIRTFTFEENVIRVSDFTEAKGSGEQKVQSFLHIAPEYNVEEQTDSIVVTKGEQELCKIQPENSLYRIHKSGELCRYSPEFGKLEQNICVEFYWTSDKNTHGYNIIFS